MHPYRLLYLGHYVRNLDWRKLLHFMQYTKKTLGYSYPRQSWLMIANSLRHNISLLEFYQFGFATLSDKQRSDWAGTGTMYEFQLQANPVEHRDILNDKREFYNAYRPFIRHEVHERQALKSDRALVRRLIEQNDRLVFKTATGQCGNGVLIRKTEEIDAALLTEWMEKNGYDLLETYVGQHPALRALSPTGVNTVRVFTLITRDGKYHVLGCRLRISVNCVVDNMAAGNLAAPIDEVTGRVSGSGVYSDITRQSEQIHPVTGVPIVGFQIPFWQETLTMVRQASLLHPQNRSIGWDIAITPEGPDLIEGNHDWCKLVWQLPIRKGLKHILIENGKYV